MKKISVYLVTIFLMTAFMACSGAKKNETSAKEPVKSEAVVTTNTSEQQVVVVKDTPPVIPEKNPAELLKSFQEYVKAYGEAFNSITKDPKKYSELAGQSKKRVDEMESIKGELNKKQLEDYQKALDLVLKINRGGK